MKVVERQTSGLKPGKQLHKLHKTELEWMPAIIANLARSEVISVGEQ
jgi:hypothetical protein